MAVSAQGTPATPASVSREVHDRGRYPSDLMVEPEPTGGTGSAGAGGGGAGGGGSRAPVPIYGGRDAPGLAPDPGEPMQFPDWWPDFEMPRWLAWLFGLLGRGAMVVVVVLVVLLVAAIVYLLFRTRSGPAELGDATSKRVKKHSSEPDDATLDPLLAMPTLGHEELARQGRFREAVHALLVAALLSTGWVPEGRGRGMTAREIASGYDRPAPPREPLLELLGLVERIWFGGRDATAESYEMALAAFRRFVPSETRSA